MIHDPMDLSTPSTSGWSSIAHLAYIDFFTVPSLLMVPTGVRWRTATHLGGM